MDKERAEAILDKLDKPMSHYVNSFQDEKLYRLGDKLKQIWFHCGNNGPKHTHDNHHFVQALLENDEYRIESYSPTEECLNGVDNTLESIEDHLKSQGWL